MIGLDTNILVRYLTQDDPEQSKLVNSLIENQLNNDNLGVISHIVLCEVVWVLSRAYGYSRKQLSNVIQAILTCKEFEVEAPDLAELALLEYSQGTADYSDYLLGRRHKAMGAEYTITLDKKAARSVCFKQLAAKS